MNATESPPFCPSRLFPILVQPDLPSAIPDSFSERNSAALALQCPVRGTNSHSKEEAGLHLMDGVIPGDRDQGKVTAPRIWNQEEGLWTEGKGLGVLSSCPSQGNA